MTVQAGTAWPAHPSQYHRRQVHRGVYPRCGGARSFQGEDYGYEDEQGEHSGTKLLREILEVAILTVLFFGVVRLLVQNYRVDGFSMEPTLHNSQYILVDKATYYIHSPERGDVIVFEWPRDTSQDFVKRIIGIPGDTVQVNSRRQGQRGWRGV